MYTHPRTTYLTMVTKQIHRWPHLYSFQYKNILILILGTYDKSNECFCFGECVPVGMLNSSATFAHAPIFMSLPHFLLADPVYQNGVDIVYRDNSSLMPYIAVEQVYLLNNFLIEFVVINVFIYRQLVYY